MLFGEDGGSTAFSEGCMRQPSEKKMQESDKNIRNVVKYVDRR